MYCKNCLAKVIGKYYCDACGHTFDPSGSSVIPSEKLPYSYFWHGFLIAPILGFFSYYIVYAFFVGDFAMKKMGVALFFIVPICCGASMGYFMRPIENLLKRTVISFVLAAILAASVYFSKTSGVACATILAAIFVVPLYLGILVGRSFRLWSARYLAARFQSSPLVLFFFLPILYGAVEKQYFELTPVRTVDTQVMIEAPPSVVWKTVRFYEHVDQDPPLILKLGLPIPLQAVGNHKQVGDITSCDYEGGGFIRKRITKLVEQEELTFDVIEQSIHFEHDLTLHGDSIVLTPIDGGKHTVVSIRTHYESYVRPSWLWEPSMDYALKALHKYVIQDMQDDLGGHIFEVATYSESFPSYGAK